jgi:hypothetical protein
MLSLLFFRCALDVQMLGVRDVLPVPAVPVPGLVAAQQ